MIQVFSESTARKVSIVRQLVNDQERKEPCKTAGGVSRISKRSLNWEFSVFIQGLPSDAVFHCKSPVDCRIYEDRIIQRI